MIKDNEFLKMRSTLLRRITSGVKGAKIYVSKEKMEYGGSGEIDLNMKIPEIVIHPNNSGLNLFIDTVIHEVYHLLFPAATEKETYSRTAKIMKSLSPSEKKRIIQAAVEVSKWRL